LHAVFALGYTGVSPALCGFIVSAFKWDILKDAFEL
jgi:hypothetical protein